jgi:hypothetical protein
VSDDKSSDGWISLFNGKDLSGWKANEHPEQWKVDDGRIVAAGPRSHLFYVGNDEKKPPEFENFHFKADVMTTPGSNSGIFFRTKWQDSDWPKIGYESQVNNTHGDPVKTASLYEVEKNFTAPAKDNEWFTEEVIVEGKHIVTKVNGKTIVDYTEPDDPKRTKPVLGGPGTFALQAHDPNSTTYYKNIQVKALPPTKK